MVSIEALLATLAGSRKVFHSEADFQHALAWQIHEAMPDSQVRLEVDVMQVEHQRRFLDIWLPVEGVAIELKYKTRGLELEQDDESFALRDQSAQDQGRYDFLRDIQRLELMRSKLEQCKAGYAVLLTNDSSYWKVPMYRDTVDAAFRVHEGRDGFGSIGVGGPSAVRGTVEGPRNHRYRYAALIVFAGRSIPASLGSPTAASAISRFRWSDRGQRPTAIP